MLLRKIQTGYCFNPFYVIGCVRTSLSEQSVPTSVLHQQEAEKGSARENQGPSPGHQEELGPWAHRTDITVSQTRQTVFQPWHIDATVAFTKENQKEAEQQFRV